MKIKQLLGLGREPFVHFLLIGAGLFVLFDQVGEPAPPPAEHVIVAPATILLLEEQFRRTWRQSPTTDEVETIIDAHVREEILYREALALGLDRDDSVVRQRLRQKMEFLVDSTVDLSVADDSALEAFLAENAETYQRPPRLAFRQVLFSPERRGETARGDALAALDRLGRNPRAEAALDIGDATLLPSLLAESTAAEIEEVFGPGLFEQLDPSVQGRWQGPVESVFGFHLVRIDRVVPARRPALAEVRDVVEVIRPDPHATRDQP